ncbi:hypothetical protein T484DRAFT_3391653 [Baffinella frigidus]|nr:hypothetical protein T484DRAFT_3391653 [Cryptophyta sp. CCMP2293]
MTGASETTTTRVAVCAAAVLLAGLALLAMVGPALVEGEVSSVEGFFVSPGMEAAEARWHPYWSNRSQPLPVRRNDRKGSPSTHTAGYEWERWPNLRHFPLPYPLEPPLCPYGLPAVGS